MLKPRWIVAFLFALLMAGKSGQQQPIFQKMDRRNRNPVCPGFPCG